MKYKCCYDCVEENGLYELFKNFVDLREGYLQFTYTPSGKNAKKKKDT